MSFSPFRPLLRSALAACAGLGFCVLSTTALPVSFNTLHTLSPSSEGNSPEAELTQGTDLRFYGTTALNGLNGNGSIFRIDQNGANFRVLSSFGTASGTGIQPNGGLVQASDGNFYGTTYLGGANALGTLFSLTPTGTLTLLASFNSGDPGAKPAGTLIEGVDGFLYGTAQLGGLDNYGTVFRASIPTGAPVTVTPFTGGFDGLYPESDLTQASDGNFYGTTTRGGSADAGTIFQLTPGGLRTVIYSFTGDTDGRTPLRGLVPGRDGYLYGIASSAGAGNGGTIFRVTTTGALTLLYSFTAQLGGSAYTPYCRLVLASDGNFYGTTNLGGASNAGTIFQVTPTGGFNPFYSFTNGADGGYPVAGLVQGTDGKLYGTTAGNNGQNGTIFQLDIGLPAPIPQPIVFAPAAVNVGDTVTIKGDNFLGATGVTFPSASGAIKATSFAVLSKTMLTAVVPTGAASGVVTVTNGTLGAATPNALTVNVATPPGGGGTGGTPSVVTILASDPVASATGGDTGAFKIHRQGGDTTQALTVILKIQGTATRGTDYNLFNRGQLLPTVTNSVTIPANKLNTVIQVQVVSGASIPVDERAAIKLKGGANYTVGAPQKAVVFIAATTN